MKKEPDHDATAELLTLICTEVARDGGGSLVVALKDYVDRPKRIDVLLTKTIGPKKLLTFLELHKDIFDVNRQVVPHFVRLKSWESYCKGLDDSQAAEKLVALQDKIRYVLRRREARIERRQRAVDTKQVNLFWLRSQVANVLHYYLRASLFYVKAYSQQKHHGNIYQVNSKEWHQLVAVEFESIVKCCVEVNDVTKKVWLPPDPVEYDTEAYVRSLAEKMTEAVVQDAATQIGLSLLLLRYPHIKDLLGGRDLLTLMELYPAYFDDISVTSHAGGELILCCSTTTERSTSRKMQVDETGLFSLTSSKWGQAMANILLGCCSITFKRQEEDSSPQLITAIDVTASVGGLTLALARTFGTVIAIEIDPHRADLCLENMKNNDVTNVDVRTADAMDEIPHLPSNSVVVIDPPWGGCFYKRDRKEIRMGPWRLEQVLERVALHMSPVLVGLRLPVNFDVSGFVHDLQQQQHTNNFKKVTVRKLGPQLFVVLSLVELEEGHEQRSI